MKQIFKIAIGLALIVGSQSAQAWKESGGGDEVALEFQKAFADAVVELRSKPLPMPVSIEALNATAQKAKVVVVEEQLKVKTGLPGKETYQVSVAVNTPSENLIQISRARWQQISDRRIREAVALHEVLSLMGVERTGSYQFSAQYVARFGISPWTVSGSPDGKIEIPTAKTLDCDITYFPTGDSVGKESFKVREVLTKTADHRLSFQKDVTTKDGRFKIYVWGVQPFRTAYNLTAYEFVGAEIDDLKAGNSVISGSTVATEPIQNENRVRLFHSFNLNEAKAGDVDVKCILN